MIATYDVAVIGSGFAGSLLAMIAAKLGYSVVLLERSGHPRFTIGESSTPLANLLLDELASSYDLPALKPLTKWGSWQRAYPQVGCGLKRGFTFFHHDRLLNPRGMLDYNNQLLVAASPHDEIADTHWFRADFDSLMLQLAQQAGVVYQDHVNLQGFLDREEFAELHGSCHGISTALRARFVVDATGPRGCLYRLLGLKERAIPDYPDTQALFTHFSGVRRLEHDGFAPHAEQAPYPIDDAAVHHIFDGGWIWVLQFNNGYTSAGVAATGAFSHQAGFKDGANAWRKVVDQFPVLREQFQDARVEQPFGHLRRIPFLSQEIVGKRWALLPSAAGFVDPLLSTGFSLTLLGVMRLANLLKRRTEIVGADLETYSSSTASELLQTSRLIAALYANMKNFEVFRAITLLYFAASSFTETVRRLGRPERARSFLLHDDPAFGAASSALYSEARHGIPAAHTGLFLQKVKQLIEPFDVAGLTKETTRHQYPVDAEDLLASAWKVGASPENIMSMLEHSGFYAHTIARA